MQTPSHQSAAYTKRVYRRVASYMATHGMDASTVSAGYARCQACSAMSSLQTGPADVGVAFIPHEARGCDRQVEIVCLEARDVEHCAYTTAFGTPYSSRIRRSLTDTAVDEHDSQGDVVRVLALKDDQRVGAVRLYPVDGHSGVRKGDRLAVADCRTCGAGTPLVRFGFAYARAHGGQRMIAHVQPANVRFFERLG